jgi:hypothetical protein
VSAVSFASAAPRSNRSGYTSTYAEREERRRAVARGESPGPVRKRHRTVPGVRPVLGHPQPVAFVPMDMEAYRTLCEGLARRFLTAFPRSERRLPRSLALHADGRRGAPPWDPVL